MKTILFFISILLTGNMTAQLGDSAVFYSFGDSIYTAYQLAGFYIPEYCPITHDTVFNHNPRFDLSSNFYKKRYSEKDLMYKVVDNFGNGFDSLYGTRNMRPVLHGVAYRGGANNYFHKNDKRNNHNPLPSDGIANLCREGFSSSIYLYRTNWDNAPKYKDCNCVNNTRNTMLYEQYDYFDDAHVYQILKLVYKSATENNVGPVYLHCWNGWHASGFISAIILRQFCGFNAMDAITYWDLGTDGANVSPRYNVIRDRIKNFEPYEEFRLKDSLGKIICPPMPKFIDSSKLHIGIEHLVMVPEAIPKGTILILENVQFPPSQIFLEQPDQVGDLQFLLQGLEKGNEIAIEIGGHTDKSGDESQNLLLSQGRAQFVYQYLINKGIAANRLTFKGYGSSRPAYSNQTKEGRAANRRIEIKILGKQESAFNLLVDEAKTTDSLNFCASKLDNFDCLPAGANIVLRHIVFEPYQTQFTAKSEAQADTLVQWLLAYPKAQIEVVGHTDLSGIDEKNWLISVERAKSLYNYLISKGISEDRLFFSGCGSAQPIASNKYRWGRDLNRRIEIIILLKE